MNYLKRSKRNTVKVNTKRGVKKYVFGLLFLVFICVNVFIAVHSVTSGNELTGLEEEAISISEENRKLSERLIEHSSLNDKAEEAEKRGFTKPENIVYIDGDVTVASLR